MDPKRKRLYFIIIGACILLSVIIWLWGSGGIQFFSSSPPASPTTPSQTSNNSTFTAPVRGATGSYSAPTLFPANSKLDISVLDSSALKILYPYQQVLLGKDDLGREDPFKNY